MGRSTERETGRERGRHTKGVFASAHRRILVAVAIAAAVVFSVPGPAGAEIIETDEVTIDGPVVNFGLGELVDGRPESPAVVRWGDGTKDDWVHVLGRVSVEPNRADGCGRAVVSFLTHRGAVLEEAQSGLCIPGIWDPRLFIANDKRIGAVRICTYFQVNGEGGPPTCETARRPLEPRTFP